MLKILLHTQESPTTIYLNASEVYVLYAFVQMYSQPHVIDYEKHYFLLGIIKLKAKENTVT